MGPFYLAHQMRPWVLRMLIGHSQIFISTEDTYILNSLSDNVPVGEGVERKLIATYRVGL